jgi:hypothetical protein
VIFYNNTFTVLVIVICVSRPQSASFSSEFECFDRGAAEACKGEDKRHFLAEVHIKFFIVCPTVKIIFRNVYYRKKLTMNVKMMRESRFKPQLCKSHVSKILLTYQKCSVRQGFVIIDTYSWRGEPLE